MVRFYQVIPDIILYRIPDPIGFLIPDQITKDFYNYFWNSWCPSIDPCLSSVNYNYSRRNNSRTLVILYLIQKEKNSLWLPDKSGIFVASGNTTSNNVVSLGEAVRSDPQDFYNKSELSRETRFTSLSNENEGSKPSQVPVMHSSKQAVEHAFDLSTESSCTSKPTVDGKLFNHCILYGWHWAHWFWGFWNGSIARFQSLSCLHFSSVSWMQYEFMLNLICFEY